MASARTIYACQSCGYQSTKWLGRCPECGEWSSLVEETREARAAGPGRSERSAAVSTLAAIEEEKLARFASGAPALDRVLGGGVVAVGAVD